MSAFDPSNGGRARQTAAGVFEHPRARAGPKQVSNLPAVAAILLIDSPHQSKSSMVTLDINGRTVPVDAEPDTPLVWVLRDYLDLTGTKFGCGMALCGACTVHLDGQPTRSCVTPVSAVAGKKITTIEGLSTGQADRVSKAVQDAWNRLDVVQCGYCQSGQIMTATALLRGKKRPTDKDIDAAMSGNVCRCVTYVRIRAAIKDAASKLA
jgi:isoquinoline 1-oxidoreductase alpha subunit